MQKIIEFEDKVALYHNSNIPDINKVNDTDMNEIKSVVNGSLQGTNAMGSIVVDDINCKNLFNINSPSDWVGANTTYTISNDELTVSGNYFIAYLLNVKPNTDYYVSATRTITTSTTNTGSIRIFKIDKSTPITSHNTGNFTFNTGDNSQVYVTFYSGSGSNGVVKFSSIQIEVGSETTPYTPYKKIIKEQNGYVKENTTFYANDFKCRNLYNENTDLIGYIINTSGNIVATGNYRTSQLIPVQPNTTYTVSRLYNSSAQGAEDLMRVAYYQQNGTFIERPNSSDKPWTITTPSNCYYIRLSYNYISNNVTANSQVQLEIGEVTPYTPYKEISVEDTGWVDLSSYVNTTNFTIRSGFNPQARKIGNMVFFKGAVYCSTAPNSNIANLLTNIPDQFRPSQEIASAGARYGSTTLFRIWYEEGNIKIQEASNIPTTQYYQGYALSSLAPYLVN